jgi:hypothetical protein
MIALMIVVTMMTMMTMITTMTIMTILSREGCEVTEELVKEILQACPDAHVRTELGDKGTKENN